jgi:uridine kinase
MDAPRFPSAAAGGQARFELVDATTESILRVERAHPARVAIDGIDAAGKTTLADELAERIRTRGRPVIRAGIDGFHNPKRIRYRRGAESPDGYYLDSFDLESLKSVLLKPLGPAGDRRYRIAVFNYREDAPLDSPIATAETHAVLLFDGIFLQRPELRPLWDFTIFVKVDFAVALERARHRDLSQYKTVADLEQRYALRYVPAQEQYLRDCQPDSLADMVIENNDPAHPFVETAD